MAKNVQRTLKDTLPYILTVGGLAGFYASLRLGLSEIQYLMSPDQVLNCDISPIIGCGPIMNTAQASIFGFSNSFIGVAGFAAITTVGMALLAGAQFKRWFWLGLQAGVLVGLAIVHYLVFQAIYRIGSLCPYCLVIWSATIPMFWYTTLYNLRAGHIRVPEKLKTMASFVQKHHGDILIVWFLIILGLILRRFWYYWSTLI